MRLARKGRKGVGEEGGGQLEWSFQLASTLDDAKCLNFPTKEGDPLQEGIVGCDIEE